MISAIASGIGFAIIGMVIGTVLVFIAKAIINELVKMVHNEDVR